MGIADVRDAFNGVAADHGLRCVNALLLYCDKYGSTTGLRNHQQLVLNCVDATGKHQYTTDPLPPGTNPNTAAADYARKLIQAHHDD